MFSSPCMQTEPDRGGSKGPCLAEMSFSLYTDLSVYRNNIRRLKVGYINNYNNFYWQKKIIGDISVFSNNIGRLKYNWLYCEP